MIMSIYVNRTNALEHLEEKRIVVFILAVFGSTNGHGLVVELVPGEGELWPRNVGNELGSKITVAAPRQARPERDKDGPVRLCLLVARHICYQMQQIIIVI